MTKFPKTFFPSTEGIDTECEPIHSLVCDAAEIDPQDSESGVLPVAVEEAIEAQNFPLASAGEDEEIDYETAGSYYFVTNRFDGYGALVHVDQNGIATTCWRR